MRIFKEPDENDIHDILYTVFSYVFLDLKLGRPECCEVDVEAKFLA
jgi:hypothetical protein